MADSNGILVVMQNVDDARLADHLKWYENVHLPDVCAVPEVTRGEFASALPSDEKLRWGHASAFWFSGDPLAVLGEVFRRAGAGEWEMSDTVDQTTSMMAVGEALTGRMRSTITPDASGKDRFLFMVMTNCTPGDDDAFNAWYNDVHVPDILDVPGFTAAQRFRFVDHPALGDYPFRYLAIYEVAADQVEAAFAEMNARAGTDKMVLSPTLDVENVHAVCFAPQAVCNANG